jgi:hypothetical protein
MGRGRASAVDSGLGDGVRRGQADDPADDRPAPRRGHADHPAGQRHLRTRHAPPAQPPLARSLRSAPRLPRRPRRPVSANADRGRRRPRSGRGHRRVRGSGGHAATGPPAHRAHGRGPAGRDRRLVVPAGPRHRDVPCGGTWVRSTALSGGRGPDRAPVRLRFGSAQRAPADAGTRRRHCSSGRTRRCSICSTLDSTSTIGRSRWLRRPGPGR